MKRCRCGAMKDFECDGKVATVTGRGLFNEGQKEQVMCYRHICNCCGFQHFRLDWKTCEDCGEPNPDP